MADLVDEHGAAVAASLLVGAEHEVVEEELAPALEQIEPARLAAGTLEDVVLLDPHHRQPAALRRQRIERARQLLLLDEQLVARGLPLRRRYDLGQHLVLVAHDNSPLGWRRVTRFALTRPTTLPRS